MPADMTAFRAKFTPPEHQVLVDASDAVIEEALEIAKSIYVRTELGTLYLAAHWAFLSEKEKTFAGDGVRTSEGMGPHSESYRPADAADPRDPIYDTTAYGRRYLALRRAATVAMPMIIKGGTGR